MCNRRNSLFHWNPVIDPSELLHGAIQSILLDPGFKVPSPLAAAAHETAATLTTYCGDPLCAPDLFRSFGTKLTAALSSCFIVKQTIKQQREAMWGQYHSLRSSPSFRDDWIDFVKEAVGRTPSPIFFQHVTHEIFKRLIKAEYPITETNTPIGNKQMTTEEENALRYVAGYVCRKITAKLESSSASNKDDLIQCVHDMRSDSGQENVGEDWVNAIDRGGLWHVTDLSYSLFYAVEEVIRGHFTRSEAHSLTEDSKVTVITTVEENEDVLFQWCMLTTSLNDDDASVLLHKITELYVTVRGFSFASSCVVI